LLVKVKGGEKVKAFSRRLKKNPKGVKTQEGIEYVAELNTLKYATGRYPDKKP
jgi:hypothetical protein